MKKKSKTTDNFEEKKIKNALAGKKIPVLVLDTRWHSLFPANEKPADIKSYETKINDLLKRQGFLVNDLKKLKVTKKKLMAGIVSGMQDTSNKGGHKKNNQKKLLLDMKNRIDEETNELMEIPSKVKELNEQMLIVGAKYCFERLKKGDSELNQLKEDVKEMQLLIEEKKERINEVETSMDSAYSLMHGILGHEVMDVYDKG